MRGECALARGSSRGSSAKTLGGVGPGLPVAGRALGAQVRAARDQRGELADRLDVAELRDPDEPVRVEVVPEQQRDVGVLRSEEAGVP